MRNRPQPCATGPSTRWGSNYSTGFIYSKCRGSIYALGVWLCQISRRETCYCCLPGQFRSPRVARPLHNTTVQGYKQSKTMFRRRKNINQYQFWPYHTHSQTCNSMHYNITYITLEITLEVQVETFTSIKQQSTWSHTLTLNRRI